MAAGMSLREVYQLLLFTYPIYIEWEQMVVAQKDLRTMPNLVDLKYMFQWTKTHQIWHMISQMYLAA